MPKAYIYMEHPDTGEVLTLGRLSISNGVGEFAYDPDICRAQGAGCR